MEGLGQLAHVKGGSALAYRKGGHALVFKGRSRPITIRVPWGPQSYTCSTYSTYHELSFSTNVGWLLGSGTILESVQEGTEHVFKVRVTKAPAEFFVRMQGSSPCSAVREDPAEIPDMWAEAVVSQSGADTVTSGSIGGICMSDMRVIVEIDAGKTVSGLVVT